MSAAEASFDEKLQQLRRSFLERTGTEADELEALLADPEEDSERIRSIAHRIAGGAGIFGFASLTNPAALVEECIDGQRPTDEICEKTTILIREIRRCVETVDR
jgi:HPt (histidine-containing phosphotransfer) domain-containing protein